MKATIRVPMRESFAYVEFEVQVPQDIGGVVEALGIYQDAQRELKKGESAKSDNDF